VPRPALRLGPSEPAAERSGLYTGTGDSGWASLYNGERIAKSSPVCEALGDVDELNATVGLALEWLGEGSPLGFQLELLQARLLDVGSALCTPRHRTVSERKLRKARGVGPEAVAELEAWIDELDSRLRPLRHFVLPGGSPGNAALHMARAITRRAERHTWPLVFEGHVEQIVGIFLNRLSDYFFAAARTDAQVSGGDEQEYRLEFKTDRWQRQISSGALRGGPATDRAASMPQEGKHGRGNKHKAC